MRRSILLLSAGVAAIALSACQDQQDTVTDEELSAAEEQQERSITPTEDAAEDAMGDGAADGDMSDSTMDDGMDQSARTDAANAAPVARADFQFAEGMTDATGQAEFFWNDRRLRMRVTASGLPAGEHGIHLHETGDCSAGDFTSAGGHIGKGKAQHGLENAEGPEAGDLRNLTVAADGTARQSFNTRVLLHGDAGNRPKLLDADGSAIIIHEAPDDQTTQPIGGAGARIACAVVESVEGAENVRGEPVEMDGAEDAEQ